MKLNSWGKALADRIGLPEQTQVDSSRSLLYLEENVDDSTTQLKQVDVLNREEMARVERRKGFKQWAYPVSEQWWDQTDGEILAKAVYQETGQYVDPAIIRHAKSHLHTGEVTVEFLNGEARTFDSGSLVAREVGQSLMIVSMDTWKIQVTPPRGVKYPLVYGMERMKKLDPDQVAIDQILDELLADDDNA